MSTVVEPDQPAVSSVHEQRVCLTGVDWQTFWSRAMNARGGRLTFDRGVLEILSPGPLHEVYAARLGGVVRALAWSRNVPEMSMGSTTWGREDKGLGLEPDGCYYLTLKKIALANEARARKSNDSRDYPLPDLAIEVDLSEPELDRAGIYSAIGVPEVWRFDGESIIIEQLQPDLCYTQTDSSQFFPVSSQEIRRWIVEENSSDQTAWEERLAEWARGRLNA